MLDCVLRVSGSWVNGVENSNIVPDADDELEIE